MEEFEFDMLIFVILTENPGIGYETARKIAREELLEDRKWEASYANS